MGRMIKDSMMIEILQDQAACIKRKCNKKCINCDLYWPEADRIAALTAGAKAIKDQKKLKREFFNSGIEYAKNELVRHLQTEKERLEICIKARP